MIWHGPLVPQLQKCQALNTYQNTEASTIPLALHGQPSICKTSLTMERAVEIKPQISPCLIQFITTRRHILHTWVPTLDSARPEALKADTLSTLHTFISPLEAIPGPGLTYISMPYSHNKGNLKNVGLFGSR